VQKDYAYPVSYIDTVGQKMNVSLCFMRLSTVHGSLRHVIMCVCVCVCVGGMRQGACLPRVLRGLFSLRMHGVQLCIHIVCVIARTLVIVNALFNERYEN